MQNWPNQQELSVELTGVSHALCIMSQALSDRIRADDVCRVDPDLDERIAEWCAVDVITDAVLIGVGEDRTRALRRIFVVRQRVAVRVRLLGIRRLAIGPEVQLLAVVQAVRVRVRAVREDAQSPIPLAATLDHLHTKETLCLARACFLLGRFWPPRN